MSAVGKDYLACSAARSGAGCDNTKGVQRQKVERAVLEGLKSSLMAPELVEEFTRAFHTEVDKQRRQEDAKIERTKKELIRISDKLEGLYDAIVDGLRTPGLKSKLENQQKELEVKLDRSSRSLPRIHPELAVLYKQKVEKLYDALSDPEVKTEAAEILNSLIDRINISTDESACYVELVGDIVKLIILPEGSDVAALFESSVKVVAGARFPPFRTPVSAFLRVLS